MMRIVSGPEEVAEEGARFVAERLVASAEELTGPISLVLSGGRTPARLYSLLAGQAGAGVPWGRVRAFWGDERCVPLEDPRSNYRMALSSGLLTRGFSSVHRIAGELPAEEAAAVYEAELRDLIPGRSFPRFDLMLLGLGDDGHVASLFPGSAQVSETERWVIATQEHGDIRRVTFTMPVLASARHLVFLVTGQEKAQALRMTLAGPRASGGPRTPAGALLEMVASKALAGGEAPEVMWLVDAAAASDLPAG